MFGNLSTVLHAFPLVIFVCSIDEILLPVYVNRYTNRRGLTYNVEYGSVLSEFISKQMILAACSWHYITC